ncbi:MAG: LacI family DNA-binding transcriptional regulator [Bryobacteraceae bacterium]
MFNDDQVPKNQTTPAAAAKRRVSIKDIARLARVSHSTVSRALRESPLVNPETAEKIRQIAEESGFRASAVARSLATSRTSTIGVVVTSISDPFVAEVVSGIEDEAIAQNYSVFLANCNADPGRELKIVNSFEDRRVDGIIVTASRVGALYGSVLERMKIPIVLLNNQHPSQFAHSVMIENFEASRDAVSVLIKMGHRHIAYIGDRFGYGSDSERYSGYRAALGEADIAFQPELVVHGDGGAEGGIEAMTHLLEGPEPPTAVFCYNDRTAIGALKAIRAHGLKVPDDISLVGFDDLPLAQYVEPPLTTVRQPKHEMGRLAMQVLLKLMAGSDAEQNIRVAGELVLRESTAAPKEKTACNYSSVPKKERKKRMASSSSRSAAGN